MTGLFPSSTDCCKVLKRHNNSVNMRISVLLNCNDIPPSCTLIITNANVVDNYDKLTIITTFKMFVHLCFFQDLHICILLMEMGPVSEPKKTGARTLSH
jgi:hypothetical protein